ncbi:MAG TPA: cellulose biosynthesis cyclic di-GMP-binding regulatory protein BcsB, partial [Chthoniobacterales bacterium]
MRNSIIRRGGWLLAMAAGAGLLLPGAVRAQQSAAPAMAPYALQQQQAQAPASPGPVQAGTTTIRLPLRQLIGAKEPMYLMTARSIYTVYVPFSARYRPRSCKLHLCFTNSIALLSERSTLRVI